MIIIPVAELRESFKAQGVSGRSHIACKCPVCGTVQSIASLSAAGASDEQAERMMGASCEGRLTGAGPFPSAKNKSAKARKRRDQRGCDWTLGGVFRIHKIEVETEDGKRHPHFELATPEEARALEARMTLVNP